MTESDDVRAEVDAFRASIATLKDEIAKTIVGNETVVDGVLMCLLAGGHALLEGVPGLGKTMLVQDARRGAQPPVLAHPVHARPHAGRHPRHHGHRRDAGRREGLRVPEGADLREHRPRRRNQPRDAEDAERAARGDAGASRHRRQAHARARRAVRRPRDAEPARDGRHVPAARSAARSLLLQAPRAVPEPRGAPRHPRSHDRRRRAPSARRCSIASDILAHAEPRAPRAGRASRAGLRDPRRAGARTPTARTRPRSASASSASARRRAARSRCSSPRRFARSSRVASPRASTTFAPSRCRRCAIACSSTSRARPRA